MDEGVRAAHIDESGVRLNTGRRLYVLGASLSVSHMAASAEATLRELVLPGRNYLHHYDETLDRRLKIATCVAGLSLDGAILVATACTAGAQEVARRQLLSRLLPRLQHDEGVTRVVVESRGGSDSRDRRTVGRLRQSRHLTNAIKVDHQPKAADPLLWIADFIAGCWLAARYHGEAEPWVILSDAHVIDMDESP